MSVDFDVFIVMTFGVLLFNSRLILRDVDEVQEVWPRNRVLDGAIEGNTTSS